MRIAACLLAALLSSTAGAAGPAGEGDVVSLDALASVVDREGRKVDLGSALLPADPPARATLLVFWASWCQPCINEIPVLNELQRYYGKRGLRVVGVGVSTGGETVEKTFAAASDHGVTYPVFFDAGQTLEKAFGVSALPSSVLVDSAGRVRWIGPSLPRDINKRIEHAMEGRAPERAPDESKQ